MGGWSKVAIAVELFGQPRKIQGIPKVNRPLLLASAIVSLSCVAVSKTPPIDVIELAVDPRLLPCRLLDSGLWGEPV